MLKKKLKPVYKENLLALVLKKINDEGSVAGKLVEVTLDLGKFISDIGMVKWFG